MELEICIERKLPSSEQRIKTVSWEDDSTKFKILDQEFPNLIGLQIIGEIRGEFIG